MGKLYAKHNLTCITDINIGVRTILNNARSLKHLNYPLIISKRDNHSNKPFVLHMLNHSYLLIKNSIPQTNIINHLDKYINCLSEYYNIIESNNRPRKKTLSSSFAKVSKCHTNLLNAVKEHRKTNPEVYRKIHVDNENWRQATLAAIAAFGNEICD